MAELETDVKVTGESSDATETKGAGATVEGDVKPEGDEPKTPLHLHPRFKELVAEKNTLKQELAQFGGSAVIAEKLRRLEMLEVAHDEPASKKPATKDDISAKAERDYARQVLEELAPEIKEIKALKENLQQAGQLLEMYKTAIEDEAWATTEEIAAELDVDPDQLAQDCIPVIKTDKKLLRMYNSGKSDAAVRGAVKLLQTGRYGSKAADDITKRAERLEKATETQTKVPKTHTPGKTEAPVTQKPPTTWGEAGKRAQARLDKLGT